MKTSAFLDVPSSPRTERQRQTWVLLVSLDSCRRQPRWGCIEVPGTRPRSAALTRSNKLNASLNQYLNYKQSAIDSKVNGKQTDPELGRVNRALSNDWLLSSWSPESPSPLRSFGHAKERIRDGRRSASSAWDWHESIGWENLQGLLFFLRLRRWIEECGRLQGVPESTRCLSQEQLSIY